MLKISKEISFPLDAVTQTLAAIGRKGAGKTYLATMIAEQMIEARAQVVVIDPVGNWWGLRVDADGKSKGKDIFIIGGEHGDIPLVPEAGAKIARLIVEKNISAVLDVSGFRIGEHKRFAAEFAEEFFHLKKSHKTPVHIFIEEAQKIIPQRVGPHEARMVGAFEQIVRLGRNYGIGATLITQRPQSVNKEVLSQVECLCVLQITGPHERKALEEWVYEAGFDRKLVGELPGLERGEGYVWSPAWLRIYNRVHFLKKTTFDASSTPEIGKAEKAASLSSVDVEALKKDMAEVIAQAEKDDPKALRRKIADLERQTKNDHNEIDHRAIDGAVKNAIKDVEKRCQFVIDDIEKQFNDNVRFTQNLLKKWEKVREIISTVNPVEKPKLPQIRKIPFRYSDTKKRPIVNELLIASPGLKIPTQKETDKMFNSNGENKPLRLGAMKILNWLAGAYPEPLSKNRVATLSGFAVTGGTFSTYISELKNNGWIKYGNNNNEFYITEEGMNNATPAEIPSGDALLRLWKGKFRDGAGKILQYLYDNYPNQLSKEEVANGVEFEVTGGTFATYLSELRRNQLIIIEGNMVNISEEFFN